MLFRCSLSLLLCFFLIQTSCVPQQPPRKRTIEARKLTCEEANRLAYRTITTLGYTASSLQVAKPGQPGYIVATKEGGKGGKVTITCHDSGAIVEPEKTGLPIPSLVGAAEKPGEFPQIFTQTFNILLTSQEIATQQGPEKGVSLTLTRLNSFDSQLELGADLPKSGVLPIKAIINNNSPRPYGLTVEKILLSSTGGGQVAPLAPPATEQGKALQGELTLQPGQSITGYLFYPAGTYRSARTVLIDKENDEEEGFSVQFE